MKMYKQQRLLRVLANGAGDSARRRRVGRPARSRTRRRRTPAAATWENRRKCPVAAKYNYNGCGRPDRWAEGRRGQTGREGGRACSRAATEVARKTQRNDGQAWHSVERERSCAFGHCWKEKVSPSCGLTTAPLPLCFRPLPLRLVLRRRRRPAPQKKEKSTNLPEWTLSSAARARP